MPVAHFDHFSRAHQALIARLARAARIRRWGLAEESLARALHRSVERRFAGASPAAPAVAAYLESLHVEDLGLACACAEGRDAAWEHFVATYRQDLRAAGRAIAGDASGTELADSLYADLFGLEERDGERRSLFLYFHGRSKLTTWLRAVLAQRHVDAVRERRRTDSLDEHAATERLADPAAVVDADPNRGRYAALLSSALKSATAALDGGLRLRLAAYYLQGLTLAEIGRITGEHEATVSRKLDRARRDLRTRVELILRTEHRLSQAEVETCLEQAVDQGDLDLSAWLREGHPLAPDG
jgi:RNA polymerase sigma-70 factor (ECF subfamily)